MIIVRIAIILIFINTVYHFIAYKFVEAKCIDCKQTMGAFLDSISSYLCKYEYCLNEEMYVSDNVSFIKRKSNEKCKLFVNIKNPQKIVSINSVMIPLIIAIILFALEMLKLAH